ncbi:hypothetical protein L6Q96_15035 [Candidatus Binatia bacterium]|nr:hypothetical protein [Candidatus Binatia bacterium]
MRIRRAMAVMTIVTLLCAGVVTPRRAEAADVAVLVISSIAAYVAFVALGAYLVFRNTPNPPFLPSETPPDGTGGPEASGLRPGYRCAQRDGNLTMVCW